jgi:NAD-dependent dihydropyrimidine dehydrogenase PreA subunit
VCVAQDKREMHRDLAANIHALAGVVRPRRILVDALVAMQGNGPGDGDPVRLDALIDGDDPWLVDLVAARIAGLDARTVPYLRHAFDDGTLDEALLGAVAQAFPVLVRVRPAPPRGVLARIADAPVLRPLKVAARPWTDRPEVARAAYRLGVLQDVYDAEDDTLRLVGRRQEACTGCTAPCEAVCPTGLPLAEIGRLTEMPDCAQCLQCWWACPRDALEVVGEPRAMARQLERYREQVAAVCGARGMPDSPGVSGADA